MQNFARRILGLAVLPACLATLHADPINENSALAIDPVSGAWNFSWLGTPARTYFIQHSDSLMSWSYLPAIEKGEGATITYGFWLTPPPPRFFLRLRYTDQVANDPYAADFDGDGIPNGWELERNLNPFDASDASQTNAGLTNLEIYQQSQGGGGDPSASNPVALLVYSP